MAEEGEAQVTRRRWGVLALGLAGAVTALFVLFPSPRFTLLYVCEISDAALLSPPPAGVGGWGIGSFDESARKVYLNQPVRGLARARLLVWHDIDSLGYLVASRVFPVRRLPCSVPLGQGVETILDFDQGRRVVEKELRLLRLTGEGRVLLGYGGRTVELGPQEAWSEEREATAEEGVSTQLTIVNLGVWRKTDILHAGTR